MNEPIVLESNQNHATITDSGICPTLPSSMGMGGGYVPMIVEIHEKDSVQPTKPKRSISRGRYIGQSDSLRRFLWRRQRVPDS